MSCPRSQKRLVSGFINHLLTSEVQAASQLTLPSNALSPPPAGSHTPSRPVGIHEPEPMTLVLQRTMNPSLEDSTPTDTTDVPLGPQVNVFYFLWWCSVAQLCPTLSTPWTTACQAPLSSTVSRSLFKFMSIESVMPSNHLILCRPLFLLPSIFPCNQDLFP